MQIVLRNDLSEAEGGLDEFGTLRLNMLAFYGFSKSSKKLNFNPF
jgi:hypothetical protein